MRFYKWRSDVLWDILIRLSEEEKKNLIRQQGQDADSKTGCYVLSFANRSFAPVDSFSTALCGVLGKDKQIQDAGQFNENVLKPYELSGMSIDLKKYHVTSFLSHNEASFSSDEFPRPRPNDPVRPKPVDKKKRILAAYVVFAGIIFVIAALLVAVSRKSSFAPGEAPSEAPSMPADQSFPETFSWSDIAAVLVGDDYTVGLRDDGTVIYAGKDYAWAHALVKWTDIRRIERTDDYIVGYKSDGTVRLAAGDSWTDEDIAGWNNICSIAFGYEYIVGLKTDGTVTVKFRDGSNDSTETSLVLGADVSPWRDIKELAFYSVLGTPTLIGLKTDGTIVATNYEWLADIGTDLSEWNHIEKVRAFTSGTVIGIKTDGTIVGKYGLGELDASWANIKEICGGADFYYGLRNDGRVVIDSWSDDYEAPDSDDDRMIQIRNWQDIVALSPSGCTPVALCADGTVKVVTEADIGNGYEPFGYWDVSNWSGVKRIYSGDIYTIGLREDGSVLATGGEDGIASFIDEVGTWKDIVEIYYDSYGYHIVGLKSDGTVVAAGDNKYGQCNLYP